MGFEGTMRNSQESTNWLTAREYLRTKFSAEIEPRINAFLAVNTDWEYSGSAPKAISEIGDRIEIYLEFWLKDAVRPRRTAGMHPVINHDEMRQVADLLAGFLTADSNLVIKRLFHQHRPHKLEYAIRIKDLSRFSSQQT